MDRNKLKWILIAATALALVITVVLFLLGIMLELGTLPKVVLLIMAAVGRALTAELGYFTYLMTDSDPNYFLYDHKSRRNIAVQKLTFQMINSRMNRVLSGYAASEGKLWNERVLDNPYLEMPEEFKPLVAYKLLFGLADKDAEAGWKCLENASDETLAFIYAGLRLNGDDQLADCLAELLARPVDMARARDYLVRNKRYLQGKMTKYVIDNVDKF